VEFSFQIEPNNYRAIEDTVKKIGDCKLEVLTLAVTTEGDSKLE